MEREQKIKNLDIFDKTFLGLSEGADVVFGTVKDTIITVDRLQRVRKGEYYAKD